jgi:hypothetical protein
MALFNKTNDGPRRPRPPRQSGDYAPLLHIRRNSRNKNIWNDNNEDQDITTTGNTLRRRRSSDVFRSFLDDNEEEGEVGRASRESDAFRDHDSIGDNELAKTSMENLIARRSV